jgi:hypothetical protein
MIFLSVRSSSPYRITVMTDVAPDTTASDYVLTRQDNASSASTITNAFLTESRVVELTVGGAPLIDGIVYLLALPLQPGAPLAKVSYRQPLSQTQAPVSPAEDPEAEAFGVDNDWLANALTASGDTPNIRGLQCLVNDLAVIAMIQKGEIFHRPDAGAGLQLDVNAPMTGQQVKRTTGTVTREWYKDARVRQGGITVKADVSASTGRLTLYGTVLPIAIDDPALVKLPGGGT